MSFTTTTIPSQRRESTAAKIAPEDLEQILKNLHAGETVTDGIVYDEPSKSGKMSPRVVAYYAGYSVRAAVLEADEKIEPKMVRVQTFQQKDDPEGAYRWGLRLK